MRIDSGIPNIHRTVGAVVWLRVITSLAWLDSAFIGKDAKFSPTFLSGAGLAKVIEEKFAHTALSPAVVNFLQSVVAPHAHAFAFLIAFSDVAIGVSLLLGLFTRLGAAAAILRALTNILVAGGAGPDTIGFNAMLIAAGAIATGAGRRYGVDGILLARWPESRWLRVIA